MNELFYNINPREKAKILSFLESNTLLENDTSSATVEQKNCFSGN